MMSERKVAGMRHFIFAGHTLCGFIGPVRPLSKVPELKDVPWCPECADIEWLAA